MEATSLLTRLQTAGLKVLRDGDKLIVAPKDRLTDELRHAIREAKPKLLSMLPPRSADPGLLQRIRLMAKRWGYSPEELAEALSGAHSDPQGWLAWTERDERDFAHCVTAHDFAQAYRRSRGLE